MKKLSYANICLLTLIIQFLFACGGGGGGGGAAAPQSRTAIVTLATAMTATGTIPAGTTINGYDVTIELPTGVTVKSSVAPTTDPGVVVTSGTAIGSTIDSIYTAAIGSTPGKVRIMIANGNGMAHGEFSKVTCNFATGLNLSPSDFTQPSFIAVGFDTLSNSNIDLTTQMTLTATVAIQ